VTTERAAGHLPPLTARTLNYRPDIDGLRAVAVLMVLVFHFSLLPAVTGGFLGVDVFFVISGFLITAIITQQLDSQQFKLRTFYANRIRRLAPALFVVLLGVMGVGVLWLFPSGLLDLSKQVLAAQFYFANIYYWRNVNYFGLNSQDLLLLHTWSLAAEEQFYLCFPALLMLLHRRIRQHFWLALVVAFLVSFSLNIFFVGRKPEATFYLFPPRAWELLMGALVPAVSARWARTRHVDEFIGVAGVGLLVAAVTCYQVNYPIPGFYALLPTVGAACVIMSGLRGTTGVSRCLGLSPIAYLGKISYSLYLVHWPISVLARQLLPTYSLEWRWVMLGLSIILAALIYHFVENPVRLRRLIPTSGKMLVAYSAGLVVTLTVVVVVNITHGLPQRFSPEVVRLASYVDDKPEPLTECEYSSRPEIVALDTCHLGAAMANPTWLFYGDSHAWAAHAAFDQWLRQKNEAGLLVYRHACPPLTGIHFPDTQDSCFEFNEAVTRFIAGHPGFRHIVLVSTWKWPVDGGLLSASHALLTPRQSTELFTDRFEQTIEHLHSLNREVYVWEPVPGARENVPLGLARAAWLHKPSNLEIDLDEYRSDNHLFFDALSKSRRWITASYSPSKILCGTGKCAVEQGGKPLYSDNGHITNSTADIWMQVLQSGAATH
jgi:peptidoglycan/LPS O-acetylase OafA/YrhL